MKIAKRIAVTLPLAVILFLACRFPDEHTSEKSLEVGGRTRTYLLHVPPNVAKPAPLVIVFHGGGSIGLHMDRGSGLNALSEKEGFLVAYPDGVGRNWNDGRDADFSEAHREKVDDIGFVSAMIDAIAKEHPVDDKRICATGISNGGIFSHYVGANLSARIAAIAPVVGGIADPFHRSFKPEKPVSVLIIQGTEDPLVPYGGGAVAKQRGRIIATDDAVKLWVAHDKCKEEPATDELEDKDPKDGCRVKRSVWSGGADGTEVVLLKVEGGGHTWPDGNQYAPKALVGRVCRDISAQTIWEFFKAHPRK